MIFLLAVAAILVTNNKEEVMNKKEAFKEWYNHVNQWEGVKLNDLVDVDDDGILTNHGIRFTTYKALAPRLFGIESDFEKHFAVMTKKQHKRIALYYWDESGANWMSDGRIAAILAEAFWGGGNRALKNFQTAFNRKYNAHLAVDGFPRKRTAAAFNAVDQDELFNLLVKAMEERYHAIVKSNPKKKKNLKGWLNRLHDGYPPAQLGFFARFMRVICPTCGK